MQRIATNQPKPQYVHRLQSVRYNFIFSLIILFIESGAIVTAFSFHVTTRLRPVVATLRKGLHYVDALPMTNKVKIRDRVSLFLQSNETEHISASVPECVQSPTLRHTYSLMIAHKSFYGNPNIPLGNNIGGKNCKKIRQLKKEKKLTNEEIDLLEGMGFRWENLDDVYEAADFDDCLKRLIAYENEFANNYQVPKKYNTDSELGAWVTALRRIGQENMKPEHSKKLHDVNFSWVSTRKCGSAYMEKYKRLKDRLGQCCDFISNEGIEISNVKDIVVRDSKALQLILEEKDVRQWINKQKDAFEMGKLSPTRVDYMDQLPGFNWRESL